MFPSFIVAKFDGIWHTVSIGSNERAITEPRLRQNRCYQHPQEGELMHPPSRLQYIRDLPIFFLTRCRLALFLRGNKNWKQWLAPWFGYIVSVVALYIAKMGTLAGEAKGSHFISGAVPAPGYS